MSYKKNDNAVSPVIGVVLCVAITVILAGIVAAFAFGMVGDQKSPKTVGVAVARVTTSTITATINAGDVSQLTALTVEAYQDNGSSIIETAPTNTIGTVTTVTGTFTKNNRVKVVAKFLDGDEKIIFDASI